MSAMVPNPAFAAATYERAFLDKHGFVIKELSVRYAAPPPAEVWMDDQEWKKWDKANRVPEFIEAPPS